MAPYWLKVGGSEQVVEAELMHEVTAASYTFASAQWKAYKDHHRPTGELPGSFPWDWKQKAAKSRANQCQLLALHVSGCVEGMILVSDVPVRSQLPGSLHEWVMYIEYLESAPWNQKVYAGKGVRFEGVGTSLISVAVDVSCAYGCDGRLALHSLPEAKDFYTRMGFVNLGLDPVEELDYFEIRA